MPNGSGVGVATAREANNRKIAIRHQLSSLRADTTPAKLSISMISGNSNADPEQQHHVGDEVEVAGQPRAGQVVVAVDA